MPTSNGRTASFASMTKSAAFVVGPMISSGSSVPVMSSNGCTPCGAYVSVSFWPASEGSMWIVSRTPPPRPVAQSTSSALLLLWADSIAARREHFPSVG